MFRRLCLTHVQHMEVVLFYESKSLSDYMHHDTLPSRLQNLLRRMEMYMGMPVLSCK